MTCTHYSMLSAGYGVILGGVMVYLACWMVWPEKPRLEPSVKERN
jgi:hypothetical protein